MATSTDGNGSRAFAIPESLAALVVPIASVRPFPRNPRRGSIELIKSSLEAHGQYRPLVVNRRTSEVLAGNHTLAAAVELGWPEIAVTFVDVDDEQAARIVAIDNRSTDVASYDERELADLLASLDDLSGTGYEQDDFDALLASLALPDDDEQPERERYSFDVYSRSVVIEQAVAILRREGFPYRSVLPHVAMTEINALAALSDEKLGHSRLGYNVADTYHPHRYHARVGKQRNAIENFEDDRKLRVALAHLFENGMGWSMLPNLLSLTHGAQVPFNFRPGFALLLLRRFGFDGATVLDTSAGYGGRLIGFFASSCSTYIGIDPATETMRGNARLVEELCPKTKRVELIKQPAEDVDASALPACDVAITSPPYFSKERYSDEETQSWKRYPKSEEWREGFLVPMLALQHAALKSDAISVINVTDVKIGRETIPLVEWTLDAARRAGFEVEAVETMPFNHRWGSEQGEPVSEPLLVLRKR
jgi:hypothetical protein